MLPRPHHAEPAGPDHGTQYRSAIFYTNAEERATAEAPDQELDADGRFGAPIVTEVSAFKHFWPAEDHHQDYVVNNPDNSYVQTCRRPAANGSSRPVPNS